MTGVGGLIGSGWLFSAMNSSAVAGPGAIVAWVIGGSAVSVLGLSFAELSTMIPETGGIIRYPDISHGSLVSCLIGWAVLLSYAGLPAIEAEGVIQYAATYLPGLYNAASGSQTSEGFAVAVLLVALFFALNYFGVRLYARVNTRLTWINFVEPGLTAILLLATGFHGHNFTNPYTGGFLPYGWSGVFSAVSTGGIIFTFTGYRTLFDLAGMGEKPSTGFEPRAPLGARDCWRHIPLVGSRLCWCHPRP